MAASMAIAISAHEKMKNVEESSEKHNGEIEMKAKLMA
jgi:hypothetical protein